MKTCNLLKVNSLIILFLSLLTCAGELEAQDSIWPQFRGINCSGLASEGQNKSVAIRIMDTGIGISKEKLGVIFAPFYTNKNRGTGLGLAIVKNIIEEHNGTIDVESEMEKGATFIITLPQQ